MKNDKTGSSDATSSENRRDTLKTLISGAGMAVVGSQALPDRWLKPVVSSIVLPAHAQTSPTEPAGSAFECQIDEFNMSPVESSEYSISANATTETLGATAVFILRNPGAELEGDSSDLTFQGMVEGNAIAFSSAFATEHTAELQLDLDIGDDGEVDCSTEAQIPEF